LAEPGHLVDEDSGRSGWKRSGPQKPGCRKLWPTFVAMISTAISPAVTTFFKAFLPRAWPVARPYDALDNGICSIFVCGRNK